MDKEFLNAEEASELLQINEKKLYKLAHDGDIPATKVTGKWLFPFNELVKFLNLSSLKNLKFRYKLTPSAGKLILMTGSDDPLLQLILGWFNKEYPEMLVFYSNVGSRKGLNILKNGLSHIALSHIYDPSEDTYNTEAVKKVDKNNNSFVVVNLFDRELGFIYRDNKADSFREIADKKLKFINRPQNSGTRILADYILNREKLNPGNIAGYDKEVSSHLEIAEHIAEGKADIGISNAFYVDLFGLNFDRVKTESFDMVLEKDFYFSEEYQLFLEFLKKEDIRSAIDSFKGYSSVNTGKIKI
ncbi:DNA binding domain protein, excisionase family [Flexistipes sinusarabici DSM 4947]|uniref:DNA binding domain protein, excisionase family n=1 Tax=Flexistipes sinusarabici (strain ATCC 49648 / DSM 4947 / MAS 10) TaxID=717231 RepID=F8E7U0_FLESM|nr:helix-turn-helix transcriptional regulator [Flexistipes sinusarabici]AEI15008.1 DNA binding domain protein, excisionase family [Flexistipes sinusarabici DSM 4947]